jgi:integrase
MLDLDCTYWAFDWEVLLAWRQKQASVRGTASRVSRENWEYNWTLATATLFIMGVLPYREQIYRANQVALAYRWLGKERAQAIEERFLEVARTIGYRDGSGQTHGALNVVLTVLTVKRSTDLSSITKADLEAWESQTRRSREIVHRTVTTAQKVLAAMGYLQGEAPRRRLTDEQMRSTWGRAAPAIIAACERFLADLRTMRRPATVDTYETILRRFGDWLGEYDPSVCTLADVRRRHIEAYKQAVAEMREGDYVSPLRWSSLGAKRGQPLSQSHRVRCVSCVRTFFEMIDALEYPERPGRKLFVRGDVARVDDELPRFIPDPEWHRFVEAARSLTPEQIVELGLPQPLERSQAILAVLLECGLRAGELSRLDTSCVITAQDGEGGGAVTHWLRVPLGKLHNDRMIPIRPGLVETLDTWMRRRGPQPAHRDERTGEMRDFLFTWRGLDLSRRTLNELIASICSLAGVPRATSHQFRHTLAVQWRKNGMKIETISRMLGHRSLQMTMRYAAVMPETLRSELDQAFTAIDAEHRISAQVRAVLSPEAHMAAATTWRESLWVDLGIGWCGLSAFLPCASRLACLPCPNFIEKREQLPLLREQRAHLIELHVLGADVLPAGRAQEVSDAIESLDRRIDTEGESNDSELAGEFRRSRTQV